MSSSPGASGSNDQGGGDRDHRDPAEAGAVALGENAPEYASESLDVVGGIHVVPTVSVAGSSALRRTSQSSHRGSIFRRGNTTPAFSIAESGGILRR
jgi:hypothetical protein